jgi:hypothetical protein
MTTRELLLFMWGALTMSSATAGLFFLKFWRRTGERLFALFGAAFLVFSLTWLVLAVLQPDHESRPYVYILRLAAFCLILLGIADKNRS